MVVTLTEAKSYLRVDYADEDSLIMDIISAAEKLTADTLRKDLTTAANVTATVKIAVLFAIAFLFEHRENADMNELTRNLRYILMAEREAAF